ncbi:MAG: hypothetical protein E7618_05140 [Ruminococcaceae bacterium]|nr:hypothetical protein [Oscillospiraceae bacterium]
MNEFSQIAEYAVKKKLSGPFKAKRNRTVALMITINAIIGCAIFVFYGAIGTALVWTLFGILDTLIYRLLFRIEYEYCLAGGEFSVAKITDRYLRKELLSLPAADFEAVAPYREPYRTSVDRMTIARILDTTSSPDAPDRYYAIIADKEDASLKTLLLFEPSPKLLRLIAFYNRRTVVVKFAEPAMTDQERNTSP